MIHRFALPPEEHKPFLDFYEYLDIWDFSTGFRFLSNKLHLLVFSFLLFL